jgi:hypothetical protein
MHLLEEERKRDTERYRERVKREVERWVKI